MVEIPWGVVVRLMGWIWANTPWRLQYQPFHITSFPRLPTLSCNTPLPSFLPFLLSSSPPGKPLGTMSNEGMTATALGHGSTRVEVYEGVGGMRYGFRVFGDGCE